MTTQISDGEGGLSVRTKLNNLLLVGNNLGITRSQIPTTAINSTTFVVNGFYAEGDFGAGATYTKSASGPMTIQDVNGISYSLLIESDANIGWFGAKGSGADDTVAMQAALDAAEVGNNILSVVIPPTTFIASQLQIPPRVELRGTRSESIIQQKASSNIPLLVLKYAYAERVYIHDFVVDGNSANNNSAAHGIYFYDTGPTGHSTINGRDARLFISRMMVYNCAGDGIFLDGTSGNDFITETSVFLVKGYGIHVAVPDSYFSVIDVGGTGKSGIYLTASGGSSRMNNVKSWFTGFNGSVFSGTDGAGFWIQCPDVVMASVHAESNGTYGIFIDNAVEHVAITSFNIENCGQVTANTYSGLYIHNAFNCVLTGTIYGIPAIGGGQGKYAIEIDGTSTGHSIIVGANPADFMSGLIKSGNDAPTAACKIIINGFDYSHQRPAQTNPPVVTFGGTNPSIKGTDTAGTLTMGTGNPAGATITFNNAFVGSYSLVVTCQEGLPFSYDGNALYAFDINKTTTDLSGAHFNYHCTQGP